ncbi:jg5630 [Pararge aegeria aegeria]|uniref:Jg5630 protein n=1 Tax=Pararge aegeria aegeria TaxID=348720 RepID=A0A8S4QW28_9NEOP|nr:jg5630 [Pararge aegeria aegeria]
MSSFTVEASDILNTKNARNLEKLESSGIFCTFFLAHAIKERRRASLRHSISVREAFAAPDDSLLSPPTAPAPTLPKY